LTLLTCFAARGHQVKVWRLITHHILDQKEVMLRWAVASQRLAIGWGLIGDLVKGNHTSPRSIRGSILQKYPEADNAPAGGQSLWDLWRTMQNDDLVILSTGKRRAAVMRVVGPYVFDPVGQPPPLDGYQHQREGEVVDVDPDALWERAGRMAPACNVYAPLVPCRLELMTAAVSDAGRSPVPGQGTGGAGTANATSVDSRANRTAIASDADYVRAQEELRRLEERLERLQQAHPLGSKGFTKAGIRKMIARLHEELAVYEGSEEARGPEGRS
jgi:hypothetical protein